ncbi:uncharacterized protein C2845_PM11G09210 [Panicum miliaceum]|uniref:Uncharacterized protein n=1 Tax=Panicum miliaceum TaxID=4540 RepID=A0A3L6RS81_PANMI|nr:uncharacterized protein C2845_PM11G09210 [Panicum miliaceum]
MRRCARLAALLVHHLLLLAAGTAASSRLAATAGGAPGSAGAPDDLPAAHPLPPCLEELLPCTAYLKTAKHP